MNELLGLAIKAHGGLDRWGKVRRLNAHVAIGGPVWRLKGWPEALADINVSVDLKTQHVEYFYFLKEGQRGVYEPHRTAIVAENGRILEQRESPREFFQGHGLTTPWDAQNLIYFSGYAMWTYVTTPFLFTFPGFKCEEMEPWEEGGETWRRLLVTFPPDVHSHSTDQVFYFDAEGLLRRHDYSVEIKGGTASANYATDHQSFDGLVIPTRRRVYSKGPDNRPLLDRLAVAIDFLDVNIE